MSLHIRGRVLGVDPGEKNIGVALSDESATLAKPLQVIQHVSRTIDAATIATLATENSAVKIIIGSVSGVQGEAIPQTRHAQSLAKAIQEQTTLPVILWDEYGSTNQAQDILLELGVAKSKRGGHQDALAAAVILQSYLDRFGETDGAQADNEKKS